MSDLRLEVLVIPVFDIERSKAFYQGLGWRLDDDVTPGEGVRIVQFTPPGSAASVTFGRGLTSAQPGTLAGCLVVTDIVAAHKDLLHRGVEAGDIFHGPAFPKSGRQPGPHPERASYASVFSFSDPDGNEWLVQEITQRAPGRD